MQIIVTRDDNYLQVPVTLLRQSSDKYGYPHERVTQDTRYTAVVTITPNGARLSPTDYRGNPARLADRGLTTANRRIAAYNAAGFPESSPERCASQASVMRSLRRP
jgi:hypothetical protein